MSKLQQLIDELCPEGVEFVKLGEVCEIKTGEAVSKNMIEKNPGCYPVINSGREPLGYINRWNTENDPIGVTSRGAGVGSITWQEGKYYRGNLNYSVKIQNDDILSTRFLYHILLEFYPKIQALCTFQAIPALNASNLKKLEIPLPPLSIQREIVTILDKFTTLEAELEAELDCRKRQYQYYRDKLLNFKENDGVKVEWKKLGEIGTFTRGNGLQKKDFTEEGVPCIHYGQIYTHYGTQATKTLSFCSPELAKKLRKAKKGDIVIATTSENVEDVCKAVAWLGEEEVAVSGDAFIYSHYQEPRYMVYLFQTHDFFKFKQKKCTGTKVIRLTGDAMAEYLIPLPPLPLQQKIADILDRFERLTTDLQDGLPAEIEARRQQYEYYRDKLLTFKRKRPKNK